MSQIRKNFFFPHFIGESKAKSCDIAFRDFGHDSADFEQAQSALAARRNSLGVMP